MQVHGGICVALVVYVLLSVGDGLGGSQGSSIVGRRWRWVLRLRRRERALCEKRLVEDSSIDDGFRGGEEERCKEEKDAEAAAA